MGRKNLPEDGGWCMLHVFDVFAPVLQCACSCAAPEFCVYVAKHCTYRRGLSAGVRHDCSTTYRAGPPELPHGVNCKHCVMVASGVRSGAVLAMHVDAPLFTPPMRFCLVCCPCFCVVLSLFSPQCLSLHDSELTLLWGLLALQYLSREQQWWLKW